MNVILLESIVNLGKLGEVVAVKPGYARNFLIPKKMAKFASEKNVEEFEKIRKELEKKENARLKDLKLLSEKLDGTNIVIEENASEEGKLFGSVGTAEITEGLKNIGFNVERKFVSLPNGNLKMVGDHEVELNFLNEIISKITVSVKSKAN